MTPPTPQQLDQASEAVAEMLVALGGLGINPRHLMTPEAWDGLRAVVYAGANVRGGQIAGAPDDEFARAAGEN